MPITKLFGSMVPAQYIAHEGPQGAHWTIAGTILSIIVNADQVIFPGGIKMWIRLTAEGHGRVEFQVRVKNYESDDVLLEQPGSIDFQPVGRDPERTLNTFEFAFALRLERLYPACAASSLGSQVQTTFLVELIVPGNILDPSIVDEGQGVPGAIIAMTPLYLTCNPPPVSQTEGTRP